MNTGPKVSVVIPAYNAEKTIKECINSVLKQSLRNIEVIVCDDSSTDTTLSLLKSIADSRLVILKNDENQGVGFTRDRAIAAATGEWLAVLDADDVYETQRLEDMLNATKNDASVMVFDDLLICHDTPNGLVPWRSMRGKNAFKGKDEKPIDITAAQWARSSQFLIKPLIHTKSLRDLNIKHSSLKFAEDTEFFLKLIEAGFKMRYVPKPLYLYRITPNSASANSKKLELMNTMLKSMLPRFINDPELYKAIQDRMLYREMLQHLKQGSLLKGLMIFLKHPGIFAEFSYRAVRQSIYLLHRLVNSGSSR